MENNKYDRLTKSLVYPLIAKYYSSGDFPSVFYNREGLSESRFYTWRQRYLRDHPLVAQQQGIVPKPARTTARRKSSSSASGKSALSSSVWFVRVDASKESSASTAGGACYELSYPNGVRLRVAPTPRQIGFPH